MGVKVPVGRKPGTTVAGQTDLTLTLTLALALALTLALALAPNRQPVNLSSSSNTRLRLTRMTHPLWLCPGLCSVLSSPGDSG